MKQRTQIRDAAFLRRKRGFSLVELLTVISIMAILTVGMSMGITSLVGSGGLTEGGYQVQNLLTMARQNSISKNRLTAVAVLTSGPAAYRAYTLLDLAQSSDSSTTTLVWNQASKWETLPNGVIIDNVSTSVSNNGPNNSTFLSNGVQVAQNTTPALPNLTYEGVSYAAGQYACEIFNTSGGLTSAAPSPCILTLTTGNYPSGATTPTYTFTGHPSSGNLYSNYISFYLNNETGQIKIIRP